MLPNNHPVIQKQKIGVLIINLGTPDGTDYWSMRRYLKEFLSDRRVIDVNPILWQIILNLFILTSRPFRSGHAYKTIWNKEKDESPLMTITRAQCKNLEGQFSSLYPDIVCEWAMRYGNPSISEKIQKLIDSECQKILLYALYPQYCAATSATVYDKAFDDLKKRNWQPAVRCVPTYHDDPFYIQALASSITKHLKTLRWKPDMLITSFHGVPKRYLLEGDPYHCFCAKTSRLLREEMGWPEDQWLLTFQSRFGPEEWLQPYTDKTVVDLAKLSRAKNIVVIAPGFVSDCLETLEELNIELRDDFLANGGENFSYIPCLNDSVEGMNVIEHVIKRELQGWL